MWRNQLELVGVASDDEGFDALVLGPRAECADDVVSFESVHFEHRHAKRLHDRLDHGDLLVEFRVGGWPVRLVLRVHLVPERGRAGVQT